MTGHRRRLRWVLPSAVALTAVLLLPAPASAHDHPSPTERAAPAVVWVEARAEVEVSLVEHLLDDPGGVHIRIIQSSSTPVLAAASGFVIDPTGAVVTDGAITDVDRESAAVYAINEAFRDHYGDEAPLEGDPFSRQRISDDDSDRLQQRLEACYPPHEVNDAGGCVVRVTETYVVHPHVTSQEEYGQLPAELLQGSTSDVAVLQVRGATSMPTVNLGESTEGASALAVLGFSGIPDATEPVPAVNAHLDGVGGTVHKTVDLDKKEIASAIALAKALPAGLAGGPAIGEQGQVVGFFTPDEDSGPPPAAPGRLVDAAVIREVLEATDITPRRGPVDSSFEAAMHAYKNGGYAAATPGLEATLDLFPGHGMAVAALADSEAQVAAGSPGPAAPGQNGSAADEAASGIPWALVLAIAAAVLVLALVGALLLRRRRAAAPAAGGRPAHGPGRPGEGRPQAPSRTGTGPPGRQAVPGGTGGQGPGQGQGPGSRTGAVAVMERGGPAAGGAAAAGRGEPPPPGSAHSRALPLQVPSAAGDGARGNSRVFQSPSSVPAPRRDAPAEPGAEDRPAFCTTCGFQIGPQHRFCGRCGGAVG
jgi:hypothetical protein